MLFLKWSQRFLSRRLSVPFLLESNKHFILTPLWMQMHKRQYGLLIWHCYETSQAWIIPHSVCKRCIKLILQLQFYDTQWLTRFHCISSSDANVSINVLALEPLFHHGNRRNTCLLLFIYASQGSFFFIFYLLPWLCWNNCFLFLC